MPLFAHGQDSIVLPSDYEPYFQWDAMNDSLQLEYQTLYPIAWAKDSAYIARKNKAFFDSVFAEENIKKQLFFSGFGDSTYSQPSLTDTPPSNAGNVYSKPVPVWIYWLVLVVLIGLIFLKYVNIRLFNLMFLSILFPRYCDEALREHDTPINIYNLMATLICTIIYALFIWFVAKAQLTEQVHNNASVVFLLTFMALAIFYMLRYIAIMISAALLNAEYVYGVLVQVTVSGNMWLAIIILPVLALVSTSFFPYESQSMLITSSIILLSYLVIKQVRVFLQVVGSFPHSIIYLILYLCALEIAPYLAIYKLLINKLG